MKRKSSRKKDSALAFYTPDRVLDIAYCYYLASMNGGSTRPTLKLASESVSDFEKVCRRYEARIGTAEWQFLSGLKTVIVSLARGIERRRHDVEELEQRAIKEREHRIQEITQSTKRIGLAKALGRTAILGGFGFTFGKAFIPWVNFEQPVQPTYASFVLAFGAVLVGSLLKALVADRRIKTIFRMYDMMIMHAWEVYRRGAKEEYERSKKDAARIWANYTGEDPIDWPGYDTILEEEQELADMVKSHTDGLQESPFSQFAALVVLPIVRATARFRKKDQVVIAKP
ncbi:MAG: hypothetical protein AAB364_00430 [Patescibacteria group bacterium]